MDPGSKTNGCLVTRVCLRYFFGRELCLHACDEDFLATIEELFISAEYQKLAVCIPEYIKTYCERAWKGSKNA